MVTSTGVDRCRMIEGLKPAAAMVLVQMAFAGVNIFYKLALNDGMSVPVLVSYRYIFAAVSLSPVAFFLERGKRPRMTWTVLMHIFFCGLFGGALLQNLYIEGIKLTSATFASAIANLVPVLTFILAATFKLERFSARTLPGFAKIGGTLSGFGGAMLLTFYKGACISLWSTNVDLIHSDKPQRGGTIPSDNKVMGSLLCVAGCLSFAIWLIIQAKMARYYPCPYSSTSLMCTTASILSVSYAFCKERSDWGAWKLGFNIRLLSAVYCGVVATGPILAILAWCIKKRGPLFASVFNPLMLFIVAILSSFLLQEKLHVGTILGAVFIVIGLYMVIWGKGRETTKGDGIPLTLDAASCGGSSHRDAIALETLQSGVKDDVRHMKTDQHEAS